MWQGCQPLLSTLPRMEIIPRPHGRGDFYVLTLLVESGKPKCRHIDTNDLSHCHVPEALVVGLIFRDESDSIALSSTHVFYV